MFPTQHDISPNNINDVIFVLTNILKTGNNLLSYWEPRAPYF